ncbi:MAG TPA: DUF6249 domain-containing protein [Candidatus Eisenbacteria bacterium]|nr:DUF6249 domain-containing protein [Candidatus Eisenbacteria bacterium]
MFHLDSDTFVSILAMAIPIVAIIGGITVAVVRTIGQQRLAELAHRERIAALERGADPSKLPPPPVLDYGPAYGAYNPLRRYHGLLIGGIVCAVVGVSIAAFLMIMETEKNAWSVGLIPMGVGVALLLSALLVKPRNG